MFNKKSIHALTLTALGHNIYVMACLIVYGLRKFSQKLGLHIWATKVLLWLKCSTYILGKKETILENVHAKNGKKIPIFRYLNNSSFFS